MLAGKDCVFDVGCGDALDELVHTGYGPMAHYFFAMGVGVK